ncbi:ATP-grasp domain-containing protein [Aliikangiella maris]|uniref:Uncharacterized protein n=2 Tax=Aliikangiella maris TaxID=3162458 RepID=A0ABV2BVK9_9GAMM
MKSCAILSMDDLSNHCVYDDLLFTPLTNAGWQYEVISWRQTNVNWSRFDQVIIRSTWDYQQDIAAFLATLKLIDASRARLENSLSLVAWNINKHYLRQLAEQQIPIIPTLWFDCFSQANLTMCFEQFQTDEIVIKPCVSLGAIDTFRIDVNSAKNSEKQFQKIFYQRPFMVQPFAANIIAEGEFSLFFFDNQFSHGVLKKPKANDFRVQEEHGGQLSLITPDESLLKQAEQVMALLPEIPLYARLDFVRWQNKFALMEAELIEPSLYFNLDPNATIRFVEAMERRFNRSHSSPNINLHISS